MTSGWNAAGDMISLLKMPMAKSARSDALTYRDEGTPFELEPVIAAGVAPFSKNCPLCGSPYLLNSVCLPSRRLRSGWWIFGTRCAVPRPHVHVRCATNVRNGCGAHYLMEFPGPYR